MRSGEERDVCHLIHRSFDHSVAPACTKRGQRNFKKYADPEEMTRRVLADHFVLLALADGDIVGMIEMRSHRHVSLLFVGPEFQGRGIGGELLGKAVELCRSTDPHLGGVTVNSSPNALKAYERMGFTATGREQDINGVRSIPMEKVL
jgi:GNAT superfamily N-acetyltransferase